MTMAAREPHGPIRAAPTLGVTGAAAMAAAIGVGAAAVVMGVAAVVTAEAGDPFSPKVLLRRYTLRGHE